MVILKDQLLSQDSIYILPYTITVVQAFLNPLCTADWQQILMLLFKTLSPNTLTYDILVPLYGTIALRNIPLEQSSGAKPE